MLSGSIDYVFRKLQLLLQLQIDNVLASSVDPDQTPYSTAHTQYNTE